MRAAATAGSTWHTWPPNAVEAEAEAEAGIGVQSQDRGAHSNLLWQVCIVVVLFWRLVRADSLLLLLLLLTVSWFLLLLLLWLWLVNYW